MAAAAKVLAVLAVSATLVIGGVAAAPAPAQAATARTRTAQWAALKARLKARSLARAQAEAARYAPLVAPKPAVAPAPIPWHRAKVSWYGPGFYGRGMAGGGKLGRNSLIVAHRTLPFGTRIEFAYGGKRVIAVVKDRGPFIAGRVFDLGPGTAKAIGFDRVGVGTVQYRILR